MLSLEVYQHIRRALQDRPVVFGPAQAPPPASVKTFQDAARTIHVLTGAASCRSVLKDPAFQQHDLADLIRLSLAKRVEHPCIASAFFDRNPIAQEGAAHSRARKDFARPLSALRKAVAPQLPALAAQALAPLAQNPATITGTITGTVTAYVDAVLAICIDHVQPGKSVPAALQTPSACIFEYIFSTAKLTKKEAELRAALTALDIAHDPADPQADVALSFLLQGRDPLIAGLCAGLMDLAQTEADDRACKLRDTDGRALFQGALPVNYLVRRAVRATNIDGLSFAQGDEVVLILAATDTPATATQTGTDGLAFGAGIHACAGQALAIEIAEAWLHALRRLAPDIDWARLPPVKAKPYVFQQFEEA